MRVPETACEKALGQERGLVFGAEINDEAGTQWELV